MLRGISVTSIHTQWNRLFSHKEEWILTHAPTQLDLRNIMPSEKLTQKVTYSVIAVINTSIQNSDWCGHQSLQRGRDGEKLVSGYGLSFQGDEMF